MTGQKDRYSTTEKLWNLDDKQIATPKHDELVLSATPSFLLSRLPEVSDFIKDPKLWPWRYDATPILTDVAERRSIVWFKNKFERNPHPYHIFYDNSYRKDEPPCKQPGESEKEYNKRTILYISDEAIINNRIQEEIDGSIAHSNNAQKYTEFLKTFDYSKTLKCFHEVPILGNNKFIIGYWDIVLSLYNPIVFANPDWEYKINSYTEYSVYIECKPIVESYGAVLRQLKTYETYIQPNPSTGKKPLICLLTPDTKFKEAFESQGIKVISP